MFSFTHMTAAILIGVLLVIGVYDVIIAVQGEYEATITAVVQEWIARWPALGVCVGYVLGHLFWPPRRK